MQYDSGISERYNIIRLHPHPPAGCNALNLDDFQIHITIKDASYVPPIVGGVFISYDAVLPGVDFVNRKKGRSKGIMLEERDLIYSSFKQWLGEKK